MKGYIKVVPCVTGEGNGTPLQCSCLENPGDGGAWWAAIYGVAQSQTRLSNFTFTFMHWRRTWQPTPVFLPGESQGWGSLEGCSPWGPWGSDMTERLHFLFSLSCIRERHGIPRQCSCLENPRDRGAGELPSLGLHRVGHDWSDLAVDLATMCNYCLYKELFLIFIHFTV